MRFIGRAFRDILSRASSALHKTPSSAWQVDHHYAFRWRNTYMSTMSELKQNSRKTLAVVKITSYILAGVVVIAYLSDSRALIYSYALVPLSHSLLDPEQAHKLAILALKLSFTPKERVVDVPELNVEIFGKTVSNPIWLAAGFDKNGEAVDSLFGIGFGAVEIGSVTPEPQPGNPSPRVFRLSKDKGIINRYGFNSLGTNFVLLELRKRALGQSANSETGTQSLVDKKLLGINIGRNKESPEDSIDDYIRGIETFAPYADYLVLNVSSPNTPGLKGMQKKERLGSLLSSAMETRDEIALKTSRVTPICIKISPDLTENELDDLLEVSMMNKIDDDDIVSEPGGISGPPIMPRALDLVIKVRDYTKGMLPIIASGGISSADDALEFARSGASAVQIYSHLIYEGPGATTRIKCDLVKKLKENNTTWSEVVASGVRSEQPN